MDADLATALEALRDLHPPPLLAEGDAAFVGAGFAVLLLILGGLLVGIRQRTRHPHLRHALRALERCRAAHALSGDTTVLVRTVSTLLRDYARSAFPAAAIDQLDGAAWLAFLDAQGGQGAFSAGIGAVLAWRPYAPAGDCAPEALLALVRHWLKANPR